MLKPYFVTLLAATLLLISACASPRMGQSQGLGQTSSQNTVQQNPSACQSKWVAAGNNGAKADRYFRVSCG
jgi:hypothetical protein